MTAEGHNAELIDLHRVGQQVFDGHVKPELVVFDVNVIDENKTAGDACTE